jgi:hypothetical protein
LPAAARPSITRGAVATHVVYGDDRANAYVLGRDDVQRLEEHTGKTLEYTSQQELDDALAALGIPRRQPDPAEWERLHPPSAEAPGSARWKPDASGRPDESGSAMSAEPVAVEDATAPGSVTPRASGSQSPPAAASDSGRASCGPCAILIPILAGGLALLLLLLLVRSCGSGGGAAGTQSPALTATPTEAAPSPPAGEPSVTAGADTPVRAGPGEVYPIIGALLAGQTGEVVGVSADHQWWAIRFPAGPGGAGWVRADRVTSANTDGAPIMEAPPLPPATSTPLPTIIPSPTVTPSPTPPQPPVAVINGPSAGYAGERLPFDARGSTAAPGSSLVAFDWVFGDGTESSGVEVAVVYESPGIYDVVLTVRDSNGLGAQATQRVEISAAPATPTPEPPRAVIGAPAQAQVAQAVLFDGRGSTAPVPIVRYRWTFGDGTTEDGARVSHIYGTPGAYSVTLVILDAEGREGTANATIEIVQAPAQPTATPEATPVVGTSWLMTGYVPLPPLAAGYRTGPGQLEHLGLTGIFDVLVRVQPSAPPG